MKNFNLVQSCKKIGWKKVCLRLLIPALLSVAICELLNFPVFEYWTYDARINTRIDQKTKPFAQAIHIQASTNKEIDVIKEKYNFKSFNKHLSQILTQKPFAVILNLDITKIRGSELEKKLFSQKVSKQNVWVSSFEVPAKDSSKFILPEPFQNVKVGFNAYFRDKSYFAKDSVTRRFFHSMHNKKSLPVQIAELYAAKNNIKLEAHKHTSPFLDAKLALINYNKQISPSMDISEISKASSLKNKIVIVSLKTHEKRNHIRTPMLPDAPKTTISEMDAYIFNTLLTNSSPYWAPKWFNYLLTTLISISILLLVLSMKPIRGLFALAAILVGFLLASYLSFTFFDLAIQMTHPFLAIFMCYYFFIPYRLIIENRKSWEYYQKNKLLTQVEELKTNFLRMMSHDLKTPLARIQGMTEVITAEKNELNPIQTQAVQTISQSSEELTQFIGSILDVGRIDEKNIKLHLQSRDVNALLKQVITKCGYLAERKNIQIITELEPMFSLKFDEELMRQVFTNLVENAIKYSPESSKVLVSTEELDDGKVIVQVADQGIGISEQEQDNVFIKFFRSEKVVNTDVKGSGLGLYLSKYFVNLHHGEIFVESEPERGSTFTVELPMNL